AGATSYKVYHASSRSGTYTYLGTTSNTSFFDSWVPPADRLYYYAVTAVNGYGEGEGGYQQ
ncbi:MAG: hypothetical protein LBH57_02310, partial [Treponema sp.]|nr:hypothetical protein [Treponema sp.]